MTTKGGGRFAAGGGVYSDSVDVSLRNSTVSDNVSGHIGGGISADGAISLHNSTVSGNRSGSYGGGIRAEGDVSLSNSTVAGNSALFAGGGIFATSTLTSSLLTISNSIVAGNDASTAVDLVPDPDAVLSVNYSLIGDTTGSGITASTGTSNILNQAALLGPLANNGGVTQTHALMAGSPAIDAGSDALIADLSTDQRRFPFLRSFDDPTVSGSGVDIGAFELQTLSPMVVVDDRVDENDGDLRAGDLSLREAIDLTNLNLGANTITFDPLEFSGGSSSLIRLTQGELVISETVTIDASDAIDLVITGDAGNNDVLESGTLITDVAGSSSFSRLDDNSRVLNFSNTDGDLTLNDLTITGGRPNGSIRSGAGIAFSGNTLSLTGSKVSGNSTSFSAQFSHDGGGIRAFNGDVFLTNSTVSDNSAFSVGGGIIAEGDVTLTNSTVSGNRTTNTIGGRGRWDFHRWSCFLD